jgi:2'-5' RNA ligase
MESARLFLALDIEKRVIARLQEIPRTLGSICAGARWVNADAMHLTIKFFGLLPLGDVAAINTGVLRVMERYSCFSGTVSGVGGFPILERPRVLWAGVHDESGTIAGFGDEMLAELAEQGFGEENRKFVPHVTLARFKRRAPLDLDAVTRVLPDYETHPFGETSFDRLVLYSSELTPAGPVYRVVSSWELK